jgi:hypothetical protein
VGVEPTLHCIAIADRHLGLATASLEVVISLVENPGYHTKAWLSEIVHVLRPGGVLWLQEPFACQDVAEAEQQRLGDAPVQTQAVLERNLLLAGFVDVETAECVSGVGLAESYSTSATGSEHGPLLKPVAVRFIMLTTSFLARAEFHSSTHVGTKCFLYSLAQI